MFIGDLYGYFMYFLFLNCDCGDCYVCCCWFWYVWCDVCECECFWESGGVVVWSWCCDCCVVDCDWLVKLFGLFWGGWESWCVFVGVGYDCCGEF